MKLIINSLFIIFFVSVILKGQETTLIKPGIHTFEVPVKYLKEKEKIPKFWLTSIEEVDSFLETAIKKGEIRQIGISAGGRPIKAVFYGNRRRGDGTTTFSGSLGYRDLKAYRGPDHEKIVFLAMAGVHGGEFEPIMGILNFLSVIESGTDIRGKSWPEFQAIINSIDRLIIIPIMNPDGRNRVPIRMSPYRGINYKVIEYWNTGGNPDGSITGWPDVKEFIPFDFMKNKFPGGYPNENGVNIQHDDFFNIMQPETRALFDLTDIEKPDLILNMHTGAVFPNMHRPLIDDALDPVFDSLYVRVSQGWTKAGMERTNDLETECNPERASQSPFNLDAALGFHCGALSVVIESPSHGFSSVRNKKGEPIIFSPAKLLDAQMIGYFETLKFLNSSGGRTEWTPSKN